MSNEKEMVDSEEKYRLLFKHSLNGIAFHEIVYDSNANQINYVITDVNPMYELLLSIKREDAINKRATEVYRSDKPPYFEIYAKVADTLEPAFFDAYFEPMDKHFKISAFSFEKGKFITVFEDITDKKLAEQKLEESEENLRHFSEDLEQRVNQRTQELLESEQRYKELFNTNPDGIAIINMENKILDVNQALQNMLGYSLEELKGMDFSLITPKKWHESENKAMNDFMEKGYGSYEKEYIRKDGTTLPISLSGWIIKNEQGIPSKIGAFIKDITERKKVDEQIKESEVKYHEAYDRAEIYKDFFAHDISNILQSVLTSVELNNRYQEDPRFKDERIANLDIIKEQITNGANLISNVRRLSQLEEMSLSLQNIEVNRLLENAINLINERFPYKIIDIKIENQNENYSVKANEFLQDVFENIFFNAVKHNEQSPIEILVKQTKTIKQEKSCIKIVFIDNGIGVEDVRKYEIFRREIRGDKSVSGIGLGLLLTKKIIESYNGKIWVEDRIKGNHSNGSKFIVMIPTAD